MTGFPDRADTCPTHGGFLNEILDLKPGMTIRSTYRIVRKLGEGGMGAVYLADQTLMDEPRALKFLSRQWSGDESFIARFRREARTLRQVRHRNVVDSGDLERAEDESLFFAMEFCDGPNLRRFLETVRWPFDVRPALSIARAIAEGMGAAHARGMVHRDIKPENVLLKRDGDVYVPKIADFGIVATKESSAARTRTGASLLTWAYAAPEQWRGMRSAELDGRTDLYALGGVLFEMLTGQTAFDAESYEGWAEQHRSVAPRPPSSLRPDLAQWKGLDALLLRLLAKDREDRPRDVSEALDLLNSVQYAPAARRATVREETIAGAERKAKKRAPAPPPRPGHQPDRKQEASAKGRKPVTRLWQGIAVLLGMAAILFAMLNFGPNQTASSPALPADQTAAAAPPPSPPPPPAFGTLSGAVVDVSGTTVPGTSIEISKPGRGFTRELTADADGRFRVEEVPSGYVRVSAEMKGFKKLVLARVLVPGGKTKHIKLNLDVGNPDEVITVNVNE